MAIWRVVIDLAWSGTGTPGVNVWHVRTVDSGSGAELQGVVDDIRSFYNSALTIADGTQGIWAPGLRANLGSIVDVDSDAIGTATWTEVVAAGTSTSAPPMAQMCVSWRTSTAGARGRGRTYLGPMGAAAVQSDGTPTAFALSTVRAAASGLVSASTAGSGDSVVIYGRESKGSTTHVGRDIIGSTVKDQFAVLRSRRD